MVFSSCLLSSVPLANQKSAWKHFGATMEAWPAVAWVLLMASIADWLKTAQSRDFSVMDIIMLHPSSKELLFSI